MRRLLIALAVFSTSTLVLPAGTLSAGSSTKAELPFGTTVANPCTYELVVVAGTLNMTMNESDSGDTSHLTIETNWQRTSGVSNTGTRYQANSNTHTFIHQRQGDTFTVMDEDSFELISLDSTPNFLVHLVVKVIVDGSNFETQIERFRTECSGQAELP